jgi:hypothetical protein
MMHEHLIFNPHGGMHNGGGEPAAHVNSSIGSVHIINAVLGTAICGRIFFPLT